MRNDRYGRHELIDWFSQDLVRSARFAVVGAGAIGNEVIKNLALLGAGRIDIHDFDRIERHNLTRSVLFREEDVGRDKAEVAAARARDLDPAVQAVAVPGDFWAALSFETLRATDCVIGCVDNFEARILLSRLCRLAGANLVDVAIDTRHASVEVFPFARRDGCACYECTLPHGVYTRIAERFSCAGLRRRGLVERRIPTTILTSSMAGALAVSAAMRLLHLPQEITEARRTLVDTAGGTQATVPLARSEACPGCGDLLGEVRVVSCDPTIGVAGLPFDDAGKEKSLRMSDMLITGARCRACGRDLYAGGQPRLMLARAHDDRLSTCPDCGGEMLIDLRDQFDLAELHAGFCRQRLPVRFAVFDAGQVSVVLDFMPNAANGAGPAAVEPAPCQFSPAVSS